MTASANREMSMAQLELGRVNWGSLREIRSCLSEGVVSADYVPDMVNSLLNAKSNEDAEKYYWELENGVFVQGQLFEAAEFLVPVLMASLLEVQTDFVRATILELLYQIVAGDPHQSEIALGNSELGNRCRARAREGLWILYSLFVNVDNSEREAVYIILDKIETERSRLKTFRQTKEYSTDG